MRKFLHSTQAKLLFSVGFLLVVITFTGYKLYHAENTIREALKMRDEIGARQENILTVIASLNKINMDFTLVLLKEINRDDLYLQIDSLQSNSKILLEKFGYDGKLILEDISSAKSILKSNQTYSERIRNAHAHIASADQNARDISHQMDVALNDIRNDVRRNTTSPQGTILILITCFSLLLAIITVIVNDIFLPLNKISQNLLKVGQGEKLEEHDIIASRKDEIGQAQLAFYQIIKNMAKSVDDLEKTNKSHLRKIQAIEASKGGIGITDTKGNLIFANQALFDIHGISSDLAKQYLQKPAMYLYTPEDRTLLINTILPAVQKNGYWQGESPFTGCDGKSRYGDFSLTVLSDGSLVGTVIDISGRKAAEKQKEEVEALLIQSQKMEAIGRLTGGIAHDFNNMLTIVQGNLELLHRTYLEKAPEAQYFVDAALRAVKRSSDLTSHLLSFSSKQFLMPKPTMINRFIPEASLLLTRALGEDVELVLNMSEHVVAIRVDPVQLETALLNLVINARDAMKDGGTIIISSNNVEIREERKEDRFLIPPGQYVRIGIEDNGAGISEDMIPNIFEPFFTTKPVGKGTGLGLSMVYGFVKQSGGHIMVNSEVGQGTSVDLYFPQYQAIEEEQTANDPIMSSNILMHRHGKILIAEDEVDLLELNKNLLTGLGYNVLCAVNGEQALMMLKSHHDIDLVLSDIIMPGRISGRDLALEAQKISENIKVLLVSGYENDLNDVAPGMKGSHFLAKPYTQAKLASEINLIMTEKNMESINA